jgi:predicted secreted Zn-dependent protease
MKRRDFADSAGRPSARRAARLTKPTMTTAGIVVPLVSAALALACGPPSTVPSAGWARVAVDTIFYDVVGRTPQDWLVSMAANARPAGVPRPFQALTEWSTQYRYPSSRMSPRGCMAVSPSVELRLRIRMPRLRADSGADSLALAEWARFDRALHRHEEGHAARAARAAAELADSITSIRAPTCVLLAARLADANRDLRDRYLRLQAAYDERTRHGARQGVTLRVRPDTPVDSSYADTFP